MKGGGSSEIKYAGHLRPCRLLVLQVGTVSGHSRGSCLKVWNNSVSMTRLGGRDWSIDGKARADHGGLL